MSDTVKIIVDGTEMQVPQGISVAAAVLGHSHKHEGFHNNTMDGSARAPYCLMGVCFECMLEINGVENVQSCLVGVEEGMIVNRQRNIEAFEHSTRENFAHELVTFSNNGEIIND